MPKYNFIISRAVDLVARKLAGMDPETIAHLTHILSEEAQIISDELQYTGQNVNPDILAARLGGIVTRMKYEFRNKGPDPSPYEFPIFNVSHNSTIADPNPINHLYDKRYTNANSKQNQQISSTSQQKNKPIRTTTTTTNQNSSSHSTYSQQPITNWYFVNSSTTYYEEPKKPITTTSHLRRSSTGDDLRSRSLSRSTSDSELNYSTNSNTQKILVNVINDNSSSTTNTNSKINTLPQTRINSQKPILKSNNIDNNKEIVTTRRIYTSPNTIIGSETMEDLFRVVNSQRSSPSQSTSMIERVIIIDRPGSNSSNTNQTISGKEQLNTSTLAKASTVSTMPSTGYMLQQPTYYYNTQQLIYQQPKVYMSMPSNIHSITPSYVTNANSYYPFVYYQY